jgi:hypothetical protein
VEISFACFAAIADVVLPAKTKKQLPLPPIQKTQPGRSFLNLLINDGVFRPNRRYDSEAQGRHVSIDKNKELTGGET